MPDSTLNKLLFRRQFILAPAPLSNLASWQHIQIGGHFSLQAHPDLEVVQVAEKDIELTLLGYMIDPHNPSLGNRDILEKIAQGVRRQEDIFEKTEPYSGRWMLIYHDYKNQETILLNDPAGLRQIFFTDTDIPQTYCASQPGIIAESLGLAIDKTIQEEFIVPQMMRDPEYWFPGEISPYKGIRHLLPNHCLSLKTRTVHRFWPRAKLETVSVQKAVDKSCKLLKGQWAGIAKRYDLAMPITAGFDSRTILAASKELCKNIYFYTLVFNIGTIKQMTEENSDVKVPSRLLPRLGLKHHVIKCPTEMEKEFEGIYKRNVTLAHDCWGNIIQGLYRTYPQERIAVDGSCSEIARLQYFPLQDYFLKPEINAKMLAERTNMVSIPLVIASFEQWLSEAKVVEREHGVAIADLFYWEQRMGNWNAMAQQELDIVQETFSPFNCRELLTTLLGVDEKLRQAPNFRLYKKIIYQLWPEVLSEPINPIPAIARLRQMCGVLLRKLRLYGVVCEIRGWMRN